MTMIKTVIPNPAFWKTGRAENTGILRGCNKLPMRAYHSFCDVFQSCRPAALCWLGNQEVCRTTSLSVHRSLSSTSSCSLNEVWRGSDQAAWTILYLWGCDWQLSREVQLPRSLRLSRAQDPVTNTQTNTQAAREDENVTPKADWGRHPERSAVLFPLHMQWGGLLRCHAHVCILWEVEGQQHSTESSPLWEH